MLTAGLFALRSDALSILQAVQTLSLLAVAFFTLRAPGRPVGLLRSTHSPGPGVRAPGRREDERRTVATSSRSCVDGVVTLTRPIEWYTDVLGAEVVYAPIEMPDGRIGHVELAVAGARWMMADEFPEAGVAAPDPARGAAVTLHLAVDDVDILAERVVAAGTPMDRGPEDAEDAGRVAVFHDPFGHRWFLSRPEA